MNLISEKIYSIEYYDSIVSINIKKTKLNPSKNLQNNKKLKTSFVDYRFKRVEFHDIKKKNILLKFIKSKISKKGYIQRLYENHKIKKYLNKLK